MIMYALMFLTAIKLRRQRSQVADSGFVIPFGMPALYVVAGLGIISAIATIFIGFLPPPTLALGSVSHFEILLISGLVLMSVPPWILYLLRNK